MDQYLNQLLSDQGVPADVDPEVRQELYNELASRVSDFINRRLVENMEESALPEFGTLLDQEPVDQQKLQQFMTDHVPNSNDIVTKALLEFRSIYLGERA
jgi:hypothetical protein